MGEQCLPWPVGQSRHSASRRLRAVGQGSCTSAQGRSQEGATQPSSALWAGEACTRRKRCAGGRALVGARCASQAACILLRPFTSCPWTWACSRSRPSRRRAGSRTRCPRWPSCGVGTRGGEAALQAAWKHEGATGSDGFAGLAGLPDRMGGSSTEVAKVRQERVGRRGECGLAALAGLPAAFGMGGEAGGRL